MYRKVHFFIGNNMFKKVNKIDIVLVTIIILFIIIFTYFNSNRVAWNQILIKIYPFQVLFENKSLSCSSNSPLWLKNVIQSSSINHQSPNNQIVYIDSNGKLSHCESGYLGFPLFSKSVNEKTRFRYASVSKLFTSDAILNLIRNEELKLETPILDIFNTYTELSDNRIKKITVEDLLIHRAGFNRLGLMGDEMFKQDVKPFCPNHLSELYKIKLSYEPKTTFAYSNLGYCLLGEVIAYKTHEKFAQYITNTYQFKSQNIKFIENHRFSDEAKYRYIETSLTGYGDIYTVFDYPSLASSAGLSGNAIQLALQVKRMINQPEPNILSQPNIECNLKQLRSCYGYGMFPYQKNSNDKLVYFRDGVLPGASSLVAVTNKNEIVVLLNSGQAKQSKKYDETKLLIYDKLQN